MASKGLIAWIEKRICFRNQVILIGLYLMGDAFFSIMCALGASCDLKGDSAQWLRVVRFLIGLYLFMVISQKIKK